MDMYAFRHGMETLAGLSSGLTTLTGPVLGLITYVFSAIALYSLAERRGIRHAWLAWMPVLNVWVLGSLSDQFRYVTRGEIRSKRKVLLTLRILTGVLTAVMVGIVTVLAVGFMGVVMGRLDQVGYGNWVMGPAIGLLGVTLPLAGIAIAYAVIRYIALYDLYLSCDPQNAVLFLILSIFIGVTMPFFLFACRHKDYGMPPRRTVYENME